MNRKEMAYKLSLRMGCTVAESLRFVTEFQHVMEDAIASHDEIRLHGFGTIYVQDLGARLARNPQTGQIIMFKPCRTLRYRPGKTLLDLAKGGKKTKQVKNP